jgi:hypothetical protein
MNAKWFGTVVLILIAISLLSLPNCARNQHLVSISVIPPGPVTFEGVGAQIQFKALGTYIHPPETKDITGQAKWSIDSQNLATVSSTGFVTAISVCGSGNVMAGVTDPPNYVFGTAFVTGVGIGTAACNQALLAINITGTGTVTSPSGGINCPGTCNAALPLNSTATLTGTPGPGATSTTWTGCTASGNTCVVSLSTNAAVTATFQ